MRRSVVPLALVLLVAGLVVLAAPLSARQGTPSAGTPRARAVPAGLLGRYESEAVPGRVISLQRMILVSGASIAPHTHPGETIWHLVSGTVGFTLLAGDARLVRAADGLPAAATPTAGEPVPIGTELALTAGDTLYLDGSALQAEHNIGTGPAVILVTNLRGIDEPPREMPTETPAATAVT